MFNNKAAQKKKQEKVNKKKSQSKTKLKKLQHKQHEGRIPARPINHQNSTFSLISNHNYSQSSLISDHQLPKKSLSKKNIKSQHESSTLHLMSKSNGKLNKKKAKKSVCPKISPQNKQRKQNTQNNNKDEIYERIALREYNSKTNSQINFSSNSSSRFNLNNRNRKNLRIECSDDYILSQYVTHSLVHHSQYQRNQAAIKIQKVFRGYMTRKMLQNFIQKQEARLQELSQKLRKSSQGNRSKLLSKKSSPIKLASAEHSNAINFSADLLFEEEVNQFQTSTKDFKNRADHVGLSEESSICVGGQDSLSKYLPEQSHFQEISDQRTLMKNIVEGYYGHDSNYQNITQMKQEQQEESQFKTTTNKIEQPLATDFSEKKVHQFPTDLRHDKELASFSEQLKPQRNYQIKKQKLAEVEEEIPKNKQKQLIKILKKQQKEKWSKVIEMLNHHMVRSQSQSVDLEKFMRNILDYSKKNKEELEKSELMASTRKPLLHYQEFMEPQINIDQVEEEENSTNNNMVDLLKEESLSIDKMRKNEDMPLIIRKNIKQNSPCNMLQKTEELKKYFRKNLTPYPVQQMLHIREKALEKRQKDMVNRLNEDLQKSTISHENFLQRLAQMQQKFQSQKQIINRTKIQILTGNQAVNKLVQDSFLDARYLGFKIPFSQSMKEIRKSSTLWIKEVVVDQLKSYTKIVHKIDHRHTKSESIEIFDYREEESEKLEEKSESKIISEKEEKQEESQLKHEQSHSIDYLNEAGEQDLSYNEGAIENKHYKLDNIRNFQESFHSSEDEDSDIIDTASKFRRVNPISTVIDKQSSPLFEQSREQLQKEIMTKISINRHKDHSQENIFQQLKKYEQTSRRHNNTNNEKSLLAPKSQVFNVSFQSSESDEDQVIFDEKIDPTINNITEQQVSKLIWEVVSQLFENGHMWRKLYRPINKPHSKITENQRIKFLSYLYSHLPAEEDLMRRLNQKMTPSQLQLLKYMRVSLDDGSEQYEEDESEFQEIGKYQLIFSPEMCLEAIEKYLGDDVQTEQMPLQIDTATIEETLGDKVSQNCISKVFERQKFRIYSQNQRKDLRIQINKIEFHCIFDALNQTILRIHSKTIGYSGIGLNQISLIFYTDQQQKNRIESSSQLQKILLQTKQQMTDLVLENQTSNQKLIQENFDELCRNDSMWIQYSDEALSFAMELVFMLQDELFVGECETLMGVLGQNFGEKL